MTVSEAIISWLKEFNPADYWKLKNMDTDNQSAEVDSYALIKEPVQKVKSFLSGKKIYTDHYMFMARLAAQTNTDRIENNGFGEALEGWVRDKNNNKEFPAIMDAKVQKISVTSPFYAGKTETNNILYQMTIAVEYMKEG